MSAFENQLNTALDRARIRADAEAVCKLATYYDRVIEKNKVMNLTAITEPEEFIQKHFIDSLSLLSQTEIGKWIDEKKQIRVIDVGTGCGMPGLALKIVCPQIQLVLFDSLQKRLNFLDEVIEELQLKNTSTLHGRAEDLGHDKNYRESFDLVVARAVANMRTLSEYCLPLAKTGGWFAAYKSAELQEELTSAENAIRILGGKVYVTDSFILPGTDLSRCITLIKKVKTTPRIYPRKAGTPAKDPL